MGGLDHGRRRRLGLLRRLGQHRVVLDRAEQLVGLRLPELDVVGVRGQGTLGAVMSCTEPAVTPRRLSAICSIASWSRPVSVAIAPVASPTTFSILPGLLSRPLCTMPCTSPAIRYWSRVIRSRSEPSPRSSRVRQNASASRPKTWCTPADKLRPDRGSSTLTGRQTLTPPRSLMIFSKPVKSSWTKWSTWMWVTASKVFQVQAGPPKFRAALISSWPAPPAGPLSRRWPRSSGSGPSFRAGCSPR